MTVTIYRNTIIDFMGEEMRFPNVDSNYEQVKAWLGCCFLVVFDLDIQLAYRQSSLYRRV